MTQKKMESIKTTVAEELDAGEQFAEESPFPDTSDITTDVYVD